MSKYMNEVRNDPNLKRTIRTPNFDIHLYYRPVKFMAALKIDPKDFSLEKLNRELEFLKGFDYYEGVIEKTVSQDTFNSIMKVNANYFNYELGNNFLQIVNSDTIMHGFYHFEGSRGMSDQYKFIIAFENTQKTDRKIWFNWTGNNLSVLFKQSQISKYIN